MGVRLDHPLAIYPMTEEVEASGRVAAVYSEILDVMPFVPSMFKSLAACPGYLALAWDQTSRAMSRQELRNAVEEAVTLAARASSPPDDRIVREALAEFAEPLGHMLLVAAGLLRALEGDISGAPARARVPDRPFAVEPSSPVPSQWDAGDPAVYGDIRRALDTPIVNSIWRALSRDGLLEIAWETLSPVVARIRPAADSLQAWVLDTVTGLPWPVVADRESLSLAGVDDAAPAVGAVLDAYVKTVPRVLVLVASSRP